MPKASSEILRMVPSSNISSSALLTAPVSLALSFFIAMLNKTGSGLSRDSRVKKICY